MRTYLIILILCLSASLFANKVEGNNTDGKIGVGISLNNQLPLSRLEAFQFFHAPKDLNFSFSAISKNIKTDLDIIFKRQAMSVESFSSSNTLLSIQLGFFYVNAIHQNLNMYYGIKLGTLLQDMSKNYSAYSETTQTGKFDVVSYSITPAFGGEYFLNPHFSFFTELGLSVNIADTDNEATMYLIGAYAGYGLKLYFK